MPQTDPTKKLYDAISERNLYSKSYEEFKKQFSSRERVGKLYNSLRDRELVSIPQEEFQNKYFGDFLSDSNKKLSTESNLTTEQKPENNIPLETDKTPQNENMGVTEGVVKNKPNKGLFSGFQATNFTKNDLGKRIQANFNSVVQGASNFLSNIAPSSAKIGEMASQLARLPAKATFNMLGMDTSKLDFDAVNDESVVNLTNQVEKDIQQLFPEDPELQSEIERAFFRGAGNMGAQIATGRGLGLPLATAFSSLSFSGDEFQQAMNITGDEDKALGAMLVNMPLGAAEMLPIGKLFNRVNKGTGGTLASVLKSGFKGGSEELLQETTQQFFSNLAAENIYDETRELFDGVAQGGGVGFTLGFLANAMGVSLRSTINDPNVSTEVKQEAKKALALVEQKQQEFESIDPLSDQAPAEQKVKNPFLDELNFGESGRQRQVQKEVSPEQVLPTNGQQKFDESQAEKSESIRQPDDRAETETESTRERGAFTTQKEKGNLDEKFVEEFKERGERLYKPLPDDATIEDANKFVEEVGIENAKRSVINDDNGLLPRHRVAIGHKILAELDKEFKNLQSAGDPKAQAKLDEQIDFANRLYKLGTELGRGVRAFAYHSRFSPEAHVRTYERVVNNAKEDGQDVEFDQDVAREILKRGKEIKKLPEGFAREEATIDLMKYIANQTPVSKTDLAISIGYANLLSGYETQIVNFTSTAANTILESVTVASVNPGAAGHILAGNFQGFLKGIPEAWNIIKTGKVTGSRRMVKVDEIPNTLEYYQFGAFKEGDSKLKKAAKAPLRFFNAWKYVRRIMAANDVLFFKSGEEAHARIMAYNIAKKEGLSERSKVNARVNEILGRTSTSIQQAREQAESEGFTGTNKVRRVNEIIEQSRSNEIKSESAEAGLRNTFNQKPEGFLGLLANKLNQLGNKAPLFKTVVPFTKVVSNVTNTMLDYTPVGLTRLRNWGPKDYQLREVPELGTLEWKKQAAKGLYGTIGITALALRNMQDWEKDNEDRDFMVTGNGPRDFRKKYQLQETGWKPYSIKVGDTYISYQDTPLGLMLATVGNYHDATKYGNLDEADMTRRVAYVMNSSPQAVLDMSFLTGLSGLFSALSRENLVDAESPVKTIIDKSRAFAIPNLIKQVDQIFDPKVYTSDDIEEALIRDIPVARTLKGSPIINVLGEPIRQDYDISERLTDRFLSVQKSNPVWRMIVNKEAFISQPLQGQTQITLPDGTQRAMEPDEHYNYIKLSGERIKRDIQMNLTRLRYMPNEEAQQTINGFVRNRRRQAKNIIEQRMIGEEKMNN